MEGEAEDEDKKREVRVGVSNSPASFLRVIVSIVLKEASVYKILLYPRDRKWRERPRTRTRRERTEWRFRTASPSS